MSNRGHFALRAAKVGARGDASSVVAQPEQSRQGRTDPEVVGDDTVALCSLGERDVEVEPDEDALAVQVSQILEKRHARVTTGDHAARSFERGRSGGSSSPHSLCTSPVPSRAWSTRLWLWPS